MTSFLFGQIVHHRFSLELTDTWFIWSHEFSNEKIYFYIFYERIWSTAVKNIYFGNKNAFLYIIKTAEIGEHMCPWATVRPVSMPAIFQKIHVRVRDHKIFDVCLLVHRQEWTRLSADTSARIRRSLIDD